MTSTTRNDLIDNITLKMNRLSRPEVEVAVKTILTQMTFALAEGRRIEIRDFGAFSVRKRGERMARNPRTGEPVKKKVTHIPHFKPGKLLRELVNNSMTI